MPLSSCRSSREPASWVGAGVDARAWILLLTDAGARRVANCRSCRTSSGAMSAATWLASTFLRVGDYWRVLTCGQSTDRQLPVHFPTLSNSFPFSAQISIEYASAAEPGLGRTP